jgi:hypothetical protein
MPAAPARHDLLLGRATEARAGRVFKVLLDTLGSLAKCHA